MNQESKFTKDGGAMEQHEVDAFGIFIQVNKIIILMSFTLGKSLVRHPQLYI